MNRKVFYIIRSIAKTYPSAVFFIFLIGITQTFIGNYTFVIFQRLIDGFPNARQINDLVPLLAMYIGANLANHILVYLEGIPHAMLDRGVVQWVKIRALEKISRIDYLAYQDLGTGNLIQIIENGSDAILKIARDFYIATFREGIPQVVIGLFFIQYYDRTLFLTVLGICLLFLLVANSLMRYLRDALERMLNNQERFSRFSVRAFMELVVFRVNGRFQAEIERMRGISDEIVRARVKVFLLQELSYTGFALLIFLVTAGVVVQQSVKIIAGTSTVGTLVALVSFINIVFWPVIGFGRSWMEYKLNLVAYSHLDRVLSLPDDPGMQRKGSLKLDKGTITFENVRFAYRSATVYPSAGAEAGQPTGDPAGNPADEEEPRVLDNFSLVIEGGKTTALVGASGSGKSTLVRLLLHLLKPERGRVLVDGQDLAEVNLASYYREVAYIPQEPPIFDGTLQENLLFDRAVEPGILSGVIRRVGLAEFARRLPQGLETLVGERGIKLSGGERQRLAFGRLMLQDPRIVILDEPTSALDSLTEDLVTASLADFLRERTVIIIAHRLQTVRSADKIVVLANGHIVQQGRFEELAAREGLFRQMWEKQLREREAE